MGSKSSQCGQSCAEASLSFHLVPMAERKLVWATVSISAHHSVAYLQSTFATLEADTIDSQSREYPVVAQLSTTPGAERPDGAVAYLVQSITYPLPPTYVPILPCRLGSREPLIPEFEWPFGECVVDTSTKLIFTPEILGSNPRVLSTDASWIIHAIFVADDFAHRKRDSLERVASRKAEREAAGLVDEDSRWATFSRSSTKAAITPGAFFPPFGISALVRFDIESLKQLLPARQILEDERKVKLLRARFSRPETERTIVWTLHQVNPTAQTYC
ncbi:hypothetical protein B0H12DRAFT_280282 [Mycena haematopus]|nr:hypothetical protein B0H12DRAFT_280282 [Mycena haematopus]